MFEKQLASKLKKIFKVKKVTYDAPSESNEQECIFVNVVSSKNTIKDGKEIAKVEGVLTMFGSADKMPFAFFSKAIYQADSEDTKDLFFYEVDRNVLDVQNIVQRTCAFVYFYSGQYDPDLGTITSVEIQEQ